jgi:hypothetical protein
MNNPLHACLLKLKRADHNVSELHAAVERFLKKEPYSTWLKPDLDTGHIEIWAKAKRQPPSVDWGTIIGDAAHDLRSALDQLVSQLTIANGKTPPREPMRRKSPWKNIAFPIYLKRKAKNLGTRKNPKQGPPILWTDRRPGALWGVHPEVVAHIEAIQPFNSGIWRIEEGPVVAS